MFFEEFGIKNNENTALNTINSKQDESGKIVNIELDENIQKYIFKEIITKNKDDEDIKDVRDVILDYFSQQARELTYGDDNNFDLYLLNSRINHGLWISPNEKDDSEEGYDLIEDLERYYDSQKANIWFCLTLY